MKLSDLDIPSPAGRLEFLEQLLSLGFITSAQLMEIIVYDDDIKMALDMETINEMRLP